MGRALCVSQFRPREGACEGTTGRARQDVRRCRGFVPEVLHQLQRTDSVRFDRIGEVLINRWSRGPVVLLGDAAWCLSFFAGYGASLAIGGADLVGSALAARPDDILAGLRKWESGPRPQVETRRKLSHRNTTLLVPANSFQLWRRDLLMRVIALPLVTSLLKRRQ